MHMQKVGANVKNMAGELTQDHPNLEKLQSNLARIEALSQRLLAAIANKRGVRPGLHGPGPDLYSRATAAYMAEMMTNPARLIETQVGLWTKTLTHFIEAQQALATRGFEAPDDKTGADRRFKSPMWQTHPYFNFVKQQYLMTSEAIADTVKGLEGLDGPDRKRLEFFAQQMIDMMSPANFLGTNPDALEKAMETDGESLVRGLENLVRDIERNDGELLVTLSDPDAFEVGRNIGASEGAVVFRNRMFELIQYTPTTETVYRTPLLIFPPWINKFYILDLKPENSFIRWAVSQGFTVFVVSWVNPDTSYADVGLDTYVTDGYLTAIEEVKAITGEDKVYAIGYCIGGTTLSATLAYMNRTGDKSVRSATLFTTLTDFDDPGEMSVFLDHDFIDALEDEVSETGILKSFFMSRTFSYLRANDLVYGPAIRSYMMGEAPPAFDLLFWNGDSTNLPGRMAKEYLRGLCQDNKLANGTFSMLGETLSLKDIKTPVCAIACETDHIAPWKASFNGVRQFGGQRTFILSESGHIAGIVNPPSKGKYGHYVSEGPLNDPDAWQSGATRHDGSWWPRWGEWLAKRSGKQIPARIPGEGGRDVLGPAPGTYVRAAGAK